MNTKSKIHQLWNYLKIQDEELLIVRSYNTAMESDEYIVAKMVDKKLEVTTANTMPTFNPGTSFQLIQQIGADGKHKVPSVEQLQKDELIDY